ncbi:MAG: hypothetical protein SFV51_21475 [Bryobacteraceae bacterium]|nr:hypothetical protein [Bryobacteraceae bacterium]
MAAKKYKCTNFANCDKALTKDLIEIEDGEDFTCPSGESECQKKYLQAAGAGGGTGGGGGVPKAAIAALAGVLAIAALAFFLWPKSPDPDLANTMIMDFFPRLK